MNKSYHFIGIGGIGMSGIANLLLNRGLRVSGSDLKETSVTLKLRKLGAQIFIGHRAENINGADSVVYSSAIKEENAEIAAARKKGVALLKRAEALAKLMEDKTVIAVTGSHGKTTTTSLVSCLLLEAGLFPTVALGGILKNIDSNACSGSGDFFVAEADESDGSFLYYRPRYSIITNIDREHLDYYKEFANELNAFKEFINRTEKGGCLFCCDDDMNLKGMLKACKSRHILFGLSASAHIYPRQIELKGLACEFDCYYKDKFIDRFQLALGGRHNISNSLAVIALGMEIGIDLEFIKKALKNYKGSRRRLEVKFSEPGLTVIDDYAHHPSEIRATLEAVRNLKADRVIAIFQPHRYTRTKLLLDEFGRSFDLADYVIITDIYPASEPPIAGIDARRVYGKIKEFYPGKQAVFLPKDKIIGHLLEMIKPRDLVITLGAGDIAKVNDDLVEEIIRQRKA